MKTKFFAPRLVALLAISIVASGIMIPANAKAKTKVIPNSYIVQVVDTAYVDQVAAEVGRFTGGGIGHIYRHALRGFSIHVPSHIRPIDILAKAGVIKVEPDLEFQICQQELPTGIDRIDVDLNPTANIDGVDERVDVDIAIIDTGIDLDHPDLNVVQDVSFVKGAKTGDDDNGHGSHCAGIAAAIDNGIGVVGVAPGAQLWAVKVLNKRGRGKGSDIIAGVDWVTANAGTIEVANMSLGGRGYSASVHTAIRNSVNAGVVYVVSAGNYGADVYGPDGEFMTDDDFQPASYPEVATISAMRDYDGQPGGLGDPYPTYPTDDSFASFSNFSASVVSGNPVDSPGAAIDLLLPGASIYSCNKDGDYATKSGTSMSSPHAAGLAALYIVANGLNPGSATDVYNIRQALIDGGVTQGSPQGLAILNDPDSNWEKIGWAGEVEDLIDIAITALSAPSSVVEGDEVSVDVTVRNVGNQDVPSDISVTLTDVTDVVTIGTQTISGGLTAGASITLTYSWDTSGASLGDHSLTASHYFADNDATNDSKSTTVTVTEGPTGEVAVIGIDPDTMTAGTTMDVTITGWGFVEGADVTFENGSGPAPTASVNSVSANEIKATVIAKSGGPPRNRVWDVRVTNPDASSGVLPGGFTLTP